MNVDVSHSLCTCPKEFSGPGHGIVRCVLSLTDVLLHNSHFKMLHGTKSGTETLYICCRKEMQPILAGFVLVWFFSTMFREKHHQFF